MPGESKSESAIGAMRRLNQAWLEGRVDDMASLVHPDVVSVFSGFEKSQEGRDGLLAGFRDFVQNANIDGLQEQDLRADVVGDTAVVTYRFDMFYEIPSGRYRSTGRDFWVFQQQGEAWLAVWRTMLDVTETAI